MDVTAERRLYAIVLRMAAIRSGAMPADHGDQARAALLGLIQRSDPALAARMHDDNTAKPYTISLLDGGKRGRDRALHFGKGDVADWRFTLMVEPAFDALLRRYIQNHNLPHVRIGVVEFAVVDAFASGRSHPESGHISVEQLTERWGCPPETLPTTIGLDFRTATAFSIGKDPVSKTQKIESLPTPRLLLSTLRKRWTALGGAEPGDVFDVWAEDNLRLEMVQFHSERIYIKPRPVNGFVGKVNLHLRGDNRWWGLVHLLADLAFWTGVGYQSTRGMGQVRKLEFPARP